MSCLEKNERKKDCENETCIREILEVILKLQNCTSDCELINSGCEKPFLGPTPSLICFNTRPIRFFRCLDGGEWSLPFTLNATTGISSIFRVESIDCNCATCRILTENTDTTQPASPYIATDSYFTINLNCVGAISCLSDVFVPNL